MKIVLWPDSILKRVCSVVDPVDSVVIFCEELLKFKQTIPNAVGLAAPQVGVDARVFVCLNNVYVNPEIVKFGGTRQADFEGCLSLPGKNGCVVRNTHIAIKAFDSKGKGIEKTLKGWEARIFQHELDHLDGIMFVDRMGEATVPITGQRL